MNSTLPVGDTPVSELPTVYKSYSTVDFLIGLAICVGASVANAAGVNLTKLDHVRNEGSKKSPFLRPLWLVGMGLYIASQLIGSTLALEYLRAEYVAPLGSTSLVFNFIFAKIFVGTSITRMDMAGTFVIILGVCGVVGFGNLRTTEGEEDDLNLDILKRLWGRAGWIVYFLALELITTLAFYLSSIIDSVWTERQELEIVEYHRERPPANENYLQALSRRQRILRHALKTRIEEWSVKKPDLVLRKMSGVAWSITGGLLAGQTLVFAKSAVKLATGEEHQLASPLAIFIILLLAVAAVAQIYCLNKGLAVYDSTLVVPLFFATYTASGFINSLTYLNQYDNFKNWVFAMVWLSILVLILGVAVLSAKKSEPPKSNNASQEEDEDQRGDLKEGEQYSLATLSTTNDDFDSGTDDELDVAAKAKRSSTSESRHLASESIDDFGKFVESGPSMSLVTR